MQITDPRRESHFVKNVYSRSNARDHSFIIERRRKSKLSFTVRRTCTPGRYFTRFKSSSQMSSTLRPRDNSDPTRKPFTRDDFDGSKRPNRNTREQTRSRRRPPEPETDFSKETSPCTRAEVFITFRIRRRRCSRFPFYARSSVRSICSRRGQTSN